MSLVYSGIWRRSTGIFSIISANIKLINLKGVKRISFSFDPFGKNVKSTRWARINIDITHFSCRQHPMLKISIWAHAFRSPSQLDGDVVCIFYHKSYGVWIIGSLTANKNRIDFHWAFNADSKIQGINCKFILHLYVPEFEKKNMDKSFRF